MKLSTNPKPKCEFLNSNGTCALNYPPKENNVLLIDTKNGICKLNGQDLSDVSSLDIKMRGDNDTEITITMTADVTVAIDNCAEPILE